MAKYLNNRFKDLKVGVSGKTDSDTVIEVSGNVSATKFTGDGTGLFNLTADQAGIKLANDDSNVGTATTVNFGTGLEVTTVSPAGVATVTLSSAAGAGKFISNDTGIHTTSNVGIGTTTADGAADANNTTVLNVGIVTANNFYGTFIGDVTGTAELASGLTGTPDITVRNVIVTGIQTAEDVRNVDSIGIVTARSGFEIGASGVGGTITGVGNAQFVGVVTASELHGDGSNLTSLTGASADTYGGSGNYTPIITVDANGRITGITTQEITSPATDISGDTNPSLGGNLNASSKNITNVAGLTANNISISGVSTFLGNVGIGTTNSQDNSAADANNTTLLNVGIVTANYYYGNASKMSGLPEGGLSDISADLNPSLGGNLNAAGRDITNVGILTGDGLIVSGITTVGIITGDVSILSGITTTTNQIDIKSADTNPGRIDFYCEVNNAHYTRVQSSPHSNYTGNVTLTLPAITGTLVVSSQLDTGFTDGSNSIGRLQVSGISTFLGNVGIGTTNATDGSAADPNNTTLLNAGIVTANYFYGNGAGLSGLDGAQFDAVVQDTNPSLGGTLDLNSQGIDGTGDINITGDITATNFYGNGSNLTNISATVSSDTNPSLGGHLNANQKNISNVGIITASVFSGSITGAGDFDVGITTSVYINVNGGIGTNVSKNNDIFSGPDSGITFPSGAAKYKINSIHVTNKFNSEVYLSATHNFNGGSVVPIAQRVIIPYQGALEIVDSSIIANPLDVIKLQALAGVGTTSIGVNGALDVFVTYTELGDAKYVGVGSTVTNHLGTDIFGVGIASDSVIQSIRLVNYSLNSDVDASVSIANSDTSQTLGFLAYNLTIPKNSVVEILERPKHLSYGQKIVGAASTQNVLSVLVSARHK